MCIEAFLSDGTLIKYVTLKGKGFRVRTVDTSELIKAEAGVTCMSLLFE